MLGNSCDKCEADRELFKCALDLHSFRHVFCRTQEPGDVIARAKAIEKRAYSAVLALSSTTTGTRPDVELRKIYAYEVAKLMQADLLQAQTAQAPSAAAATPSVCTLSHGEMSCQL